MVEDYQAIRNVPIKLQLQLDLILCDQKKLGSLHLAWSHQQGYAELIGRHQQSRWRQLHELF